MQTMTSRERILAAMRRETVDYVPCSPSFNPLYPKQRTSWNFPWPQNAQIEERTRIQVEMGLDVALVMAISVARPGPDVSSRTWVEGGVLHKVYSTPAGELHASVRYDDKWPHGEDIPLFDDFNVAHFVKPWLSNEADLRCLRHVLRRDTSGEVRRQATELAARYRKVADQYQLPFVAQTGQGLTGAQKLCGAEALCLMMLDNPGLVRQYLELEHELNMAGIELAVELGADIVRRNGFYETADFYGPAMLEDFVGSQIRAEHRLIRQAGVLSSYLVHSGVMPILDYLGTLECDNLFGIDIAFKGVDINVIRDKLSSKISLWTGPSSTYHLYGTPEVVRQAVRTAMETFGPRGFILAPAVSSHSIMPWESTLAMIDEWKKLRGSAGGSGDSTRRGT